MYIQVIGLLFVSVNMSILKTNTLNHNPEVTCISASTKQKEEIRKVQQSVTCQSNT
jgi:hypothetical protein